MKTYIKSPAKINLHLEILDIRSDGFHNLLSIVQLISLYDEIEISESDIDVFECNIPVLKKNNIVPEAVSVFRNFTGIDKPVKINLNKEIPFGAGLGGGSGNAASVLLGLNELFDAGLSKQQLTELSTVLGSDIPLFLGAAASVISGR